MNAKLCKRLRKQARAATVGRPASGWVRGPHDNAVVDPLTTRGHYRALKRAAK